MAKIRGLQQRGRTYYSRIVVPKALVPHFGRSEILKSLRTKLRSEAEALHLEHAAQWAAAFAEVERNPRIVSERPSTGRYLKNDEVAALARRFFLRRMHPHKLSCSARYCINLRWAGHVCVQCHFQLPSPLKKTDALIPPRLER